MLISKFFSRFGAKHQRARNGKKSLNLLRFAAKKTQYFYAQYLGNMYDIQQNYEKAAQWYHSAATQGDCESQYQLGNYYGKGRGVEQNSKKAAKYYQKAATKGHREAQYQLGWLYENNIGVPQNGKKAVKWYLLAARQGDRRAPFKLGNMYRDGKCVPQDYLKASIWFTIADTMGHPTLDKRDKITQEELTAMIEENRSEVLDEDKESANWYYLLAAQYGSAKASFKLGKMYRDGRIMPKDYVKAYVWFSIADIMGHSTALERRDLISDELTANQIASAKEQVNELYVKFFS